MCSQSLQRTDVKEIGRYNNMLYSFKRTKCCDDCVVSGAEKVISGVRQSIMLCPLLTLCFSHQRSLMY